MDLHFEQEIKAPAEKVWEVLGKQFAEIGEWAPGVASSRVLDMSEIPSPVKVAASAPVPGRATGNPFGETKEVLTRYSEEKMEFTFEGVGLPPIFSSAQNTTRVIKKGATKSLVIFDAQLVAKGFFKFLNPLLRRRLSRSKFGPGTLIKDLKRYVETGKAIK